MSKPMPSKEALEAEYKAAGSKAALAPIYGVSAKTVERWFDRLGIRSQEASGRSVRPDKRRGGRKYKRNGKRPQHVSPELGRRMRELKRDHPEWSCAKVREESGATCTRQMVALVLAGKRCIAAEAFPPGTAPPVSAPADDGPSQEPFELPDAALPVPPTLIVNRGRAPARLTFGGVTGRGG